MQLLPASGINDLSVLHSRSSFIAEEITKREVNARAEQAQRMLTQ